MRLNCFCSSKNSTNRVYQYGIQQAAVDRKAINTSGGHQSDFDYSEKVIETDFVRLSLSLPVRDQ